MTALGQTPSALLFGEALVGYGSVEPTLCTAPQFTRFPGGADLNVAVGLARLGVRATWASALGDDAHGDYLADAIAQLGTTALARRAAGPTALMFTADLQQRLDPAAAVGALVTTRRGDLIAMPSRVEVEDLLARPATRSTLLA